MHYTGPPIQHSQWLGNGLFHCSDNCLTLWSTLFFPCVTYAENGQLLYQDRQSAFIEDCLVYGVICWFTGCSCLLGISRRKDLRRKYNIPESPCDDVLVHLFCHPCALCQEHRELMERHGLGARRQAPVQQIPVPVTQVSYEPMLGKQSHRHIDVPPSLPKV